MCQEVCPFNKAEDSTIALPSVDRFIQMSEDDFKKTFGKTAFERAGLEKLKRNIRALPKKQEEKMPVPDKSW